MIGVMSNEEIEATLRRHWIGRLACSANDRPYVVPIAYNYDGRYIYSYSALGRKIEIMREQPLVCFEVDEIDGASSWRSVVAEAVYEELVDNGERRMAIAYLNDGEERLVSRSLDARSPIVVFRLRLTDWSGRFEQRDA
jgi:nitroimidazol reductase NimA-like FMN-containing flavoprotein (pyridoxamine 5'-phosphate oxidase superfamily)